MNALVKLAVICGAAVISFAPATAAHADEPHISLNTGSGWTHDPEQSLFDFSHIAPGWTGSAVVGVRNDSTTTATVTLSSSNVVEDENGCNHPESLIDTSCSDPGGELGRELILSVYPNDAQTERPIWRGTLYDLEQGVTLAQNLEPSAGNDYRLDAEFPHSSGNETQTDQVGFDLRWTLTDGSTSDSVAVEGSKFGRTGGHPLMAKLIQALPLTGSSVGRLVYSGAWLLVAGSCLLALARVKRRSVAG